MQISPMAPLKAHVLDRLIYLIFTNDLAKNVIHCNTIMFADDTTLYKTHNNLRFLKWSLEQEFSTLLDWLRANKLTLNVDKTACILFQKKWLYKGNRIRSRGYNNFLSKHSQIPWDVVRQTLKLVHSPE